MTHNKVLNNITSFFSQASLSVTKENEFNENDEIETADMLLVPRGERCTTHVDPNWKEITVRVRKHCMLL